MGDTLIYSRVSSKGQADNFSLDAQERGCSEYARQNNLSIAKEWKVVESAWGKVERKSFNQMIDYAKKHRNIKHIIFDIEDRMTRNYRDKLRIDDLILNYGINIHIASTKKVYTKNLSSEDKFIMNINVAINGKLSDDISMKSKIGMNEKAKQGIFPSRAPTGYLNNKATKEIDIDPISAPLVKEIFELTATGRYSLSMLVDEFYSRGLRVKRGDKLSKAGKATLHRIIHSKFYYGIIEWGDNVYQGKHTPIISKELWNKAQKAITSLHRPSKTKMNFPFSNLIICGVCDCTVLGTNAKKRYKKHSTIYQYYHCSLSKGRHKHDGYLKESEIAEKFKEKIEAVALPEVLSECIGEGLKEIAKKKALMIGNKKDILQADYNTNLSKLKKLYSLQLEKEMNKIEIMLFEQTKSELTEKITELQGELENCSDNPKETLDKALKTLEILSNINKRYNQADNYKKAKIIKFITETNKLYGKEIKTTYRQPFNYLIQAKNELTKNKEVIENSMASKISTKDLVKGG